MPRLPWIWNPKINSCKDCKKYSNPLKFIDWSHAPFLLKAMLDIQDKWNFNTPYHEISI